jgi:NADH dehydrogenase FAD-containing subunit
MPRENVLEGRLRQKVVIIGGGFAGLSAAKALSRQPVDTILIDRRNHHTFQPLLYQVALGVLGKRHYTASANRTAEGYKCSGRS